ncbi:hypothetical protein HYU93_02665 [Candidatus Daviesbacteria bacterium]|nr:hypothetical protein [Candidatus Daviesbacteria bacterium]
MYDIRPKSGTIGDDYDKLIASLPEEEQIKLMTTLAKYPKSLPRSMRTENVGRVEKKGKFWQYYIVSNGNRVIYDVKDRPKQVIIQFAGDHEEAAIWLRNNAR